MILFPNKSLIFNLDNMKDFDEQFLRNYDEDKYHDPHLYLTKEVQEEVLEMQGLAVTSISLCNIAAIVLTAPLQTIVTSLQLSVKPHKDIFQEPTAKGTQLARINTSLTVQEKRRLELIIRSGGEQKPFTAPVYEGYASTIKGLYNQGPRAFFKGLTFRMMHQLAHFYSFTEIALLSGNQTHQHQKSRLTIQLGKLYLLQCLSDVTFNMFHILENRYILQNNISQFKVFRNATRVIKKMMMRKELLVGVKYHFLNNFFATFTRMPFLFGVFNQKINKSLALVYYASEVLMYPFNTSFRRLVCQHTEIPGMIPLRYKSIWHGVRLIFSEEGILGMYKGFGLYHMTILAKLGLLYNCKPLMGELNKF